MTPDQQNILTLINKINAEQFNGWFYPSSVMAFVQVESAFKAQAYRREPSGVISYGLMQILDRTAQGIGFKGAFGELYDPETGLTWGMEYARQIWDQLAHSFGRDPTLIEWCSAYNEGPGNVLKGRKDTAYAVPWMAAKTHWAALVDGPAMAAAAAAVAPEGSPQKPFAMPPPAQPERRSVPRPAPGDDPGDMTTAELNRAELARVTKP